MAIGARIKSARQVARMTQQQVGDKLRPQHTRKNVCKWEHGQTEPSLSTIEQLAAALGVSPCWLAFGCEPWQLSRERSRGRACLRGINWTDKNKYD